MNSTEPPIETQATGVYALGLDLNTLPNEPRVDQAVNPLPVCFCVAGADYYLDCDFLGKDLAARRSS